MAVLPKIIVSYVVGLGIEFAVAQVKKEEIQEGFLVSGILIPMIVPVDTPLWMIAVATAFAVIFAKEVFGGTGYNIFNVALVTRAFLFFAYPAAMSGDQVFVRTADTFGIGAGQVVDGFSGATPLGQVAIAGKEMIGSFQAVDVLGNPISTWDAFIGLIPGSIGETSVLAILIGAVILLVTGIASWKTMVSVFVGGAFMSLIFNMVGTTVAMCVSPLDHLFLGGFAFGAVFMATDPVTSARTETGKYIYGFLVGAMAIIIRALNPGYPEGMMLAILLMNVFAPLIDYYVVEANISRRLKRVINKVRRNMAKYKCKVCGYVHEGNKAPDTCPVCSAPASEFEEIKEEGAAKKGINRDSNVYTVVYAAVMVVLVAVVLAFTSQSLRSFQKQNRDNDKRQQILRSINVNVSSSEAETKYNELIKEAFLVNENGEKVEGDAFATDVVKAAAEHQYPVFVANVDGQPKYIMALHGAGLWGPLWGYISVDSDKNTIYGADFSHQGETPGLGAEISKPVFSNEFKGKKIFMSGEFKSVAVVKPGKSVAGQDYVDGISGGTITSKGVDEMLFNSLSGYVKFLTSQN